MGTFGWTELIDVANAIRRNMVGGEFNVSGLMAVLRNEVCSQWARNRGNKERFEFALMVKTGGQRPQGCGTGGACDGE